MSKKLAPITEEEKQRLFYGLCLALVKIKDIGEAAELLQDLLSPYEAEAIARRLKIAECLMDDESYEEIQEKLGSSSSTIARVQEWIRLSGGGYRKALEKIRKGKKKFATKQEIKMERRLMDERRMADIGSMKRRYPMYYWPQVVLENIVENSNKKQLGKMETVLKQMEKMQKKPEVYDRLRRIMMRQRRGLGTISQK